MAEVPTMNCIFGNADWGLLYVINVCSTRPPIQTNEKREWVPVDTTVDDGLPCSLHLEESNELFANI